MQTDGFLAVIPHEDGTLLCARLDFGDFVFAELPVPVELEEWARAVEDNAFDLDRAAAELADEHGGSVCYLPASLAC